MSGPAIRKKDLVDRVTARPGVMKKDLNRLSKQFWLNHPMPSRRAKSLFFRTLVV